MFKRNPLEKILKQAYKYLNNQEYMKAKDMYLKALAIDPGNLSVLNNLAQLCAILGDNKKSKGYNEILLKECDKHLKHEKTETVLIFKSNALIALDRKDESNEILDELLKISPNNIVGLFQKSHYLEINKQHEEAIDYLNQILKQQPYNIAALLSKGRNFVEIGEFSQAEDCYNLVFKIETKNKTAINLKSQLLKKRDNVTITPHDFMLNAVERFEIKDFKKSEELFKKAINLSPYYDEIWFAQGELYIRTGKITKAINSFKKAFELNSNSGGIAKKKEFFKMLNRMKKINSILGYEK